VSFTADLYTHLSGYAGLSAYVGSKVYPNKVPQTAAAPYLMYFQVYREKNYTYAGYNGTSIYSMQISAYATTDDEVRLITDQVAAAMAAYPMANRKIGFAYQKDENSTWREDLGLYEIDMDFDIFYSD